MKVFSTIANKAFSLLRKTPCKKPLDFISSVPNIYKAGKANDAVLGGSKAVIKNFNKTFDGPIPSVFTAAGGVAGAAFIPIFGGCSIGMTGGYYVGKTVVKAGKLISKLFF